MINAYSDEPHPHSGTVNVTLVMDTEEEFSAVWPAIGLICQCRWTESRDRADGKLAIMQRWVPGCTSHPEGINTVPKYFTLEYPVSVTVMK